MTDIVERLRALVVMDEVGSNNPLGRDAADEIERLREREAELQAQCGYTESINTLEIERLRGEIEQYRERLGLR